MSPAFSVYLDLIRFLSAIAVFIGHVQGLTDFDFRIAWHGHDAVIVFFVLSGFVIAYARAEKETEPVVFITRRLSRLYSVALPAILLSFVLDRIGHAIDPALYLDEEVRFDQPVKTALVSLSFTNELWFRSLEAFSNSPFWSLSYEFSYYVIFACGAFLRGLVRIAAVVLALTVAGPKILLLMPIWLLGVGLYRIRWRERWPPSAGWLLSILSTIALVLPDLNVLDGVTLPWATTIPPDEPYPDWGYSQYFRTDYPFAVLVFLNFLGVSIVSRSVTTVWPVIGRPIKALASYTFSLYLFHYPLLLLFAVVLPDERDDGLRALTLTLGTFTATILIGQFTERKRAGFERKIMAPAVTAIAGLTRRLRAAHPDVQP